jgi:hypothetical protein
MARTVCKFMGVAFILIALWGFVTRTQVLIFHVNPLHNVVHLVSGAAALACAWRSERAAALFAAVFGAVYGLVALAGFAGVQPVIDALHLNTADNWLHVGITVVFLAAAVASRAALKLPHTPPTPAAHAR